MDSPRNPNVTSVSAFFPCYNDALSIGKMVRDVHAALKTRVDDFEIIVVNDEIGRASCRERVCLAV